MLKIKNNYNSGYDVKTVIDGTVQVRVYCENKLVDDVCVALPKLGVECGGEAMVYAYMKKHMLGTDKKYKFEIQPNRLWLMEL